MLKKKFQYLKFHQPRFEPTPTLYWDGFVSKVISKLDGAGQRRPLIIIFTHYRSVPSSVTQQSPPCTQLSTPECFLDIFIILIQQIIKTFYKIWDPKEFF